MNSIAFYSSDIYIYRAGILLAVAIVSSALCALVLNAFADRKNLRAMFSVVVLSLLFSPVLSRVVYWYCCHEQFDSFWQVFTEINKGGYSLFGAMLGVLVSAVAVRLMGLTDSLFTLFDCIVPAGALGISIGRLAAFFTVDDKGKMVMHGKFWQGFPFSVQVINESTGSSEWRFATFFFESIAAFVIFVAVMWIFHLTYARKSFACGTTFLMFLSLYGATQATLESTRYDALFLRSNGFISLMQIAAIIMLVVPTVVFSVRSIKACGTSKTLCIFWGVTLLLLGCAIYLEYYVQRHASAAAVCYPLMLLSLLGVSFITLQIVLKAESSQSK